MRDLEIAAKIGISNQKASRWRKRFLEVGPAGLLKDASRPGRIPSIPGVTVDRVIEMTTSQNPGPVTPWSTRTMAAAVAISEASVRRIWRAYGLKPHEWKPVEEKKVFDRRNRRMEGCEHSLGPHAALKLPTCK
jgi:transposase